MKTKSLARLFAGLLVIAVGVGILLNSFGVINFGEIVKHWWPLIPIGVGIVGIISNPRQWVWSALFAIAGVAFLLRQLGYVDFNVAGLIWPTVIIIAGLSIIFQGKAWGSKPTEDTDDITNATVLFSGQNARNMSQNYQGGDVTAIFGGVDLDLRDAKIKDNVTLTVLAACGGVDIKVPEGWAVKVTGMPVFGGWEDKTTKPTDKNAPRLTIKATCIFGGFSVGHKKY